jgi:hypothetical protein
VRDSFLINFSHPLYDLIHAHSSHYVYDLIHAHSSHYVSKVSAQYILKAVNVLVHRIFQFPGELKTYCLKEVEPLEREVEQVQIIALTSALQGGVRVMTLDRSNGTQFTSFYRYKCTNTDRLSGAGPLNHHDFPDGHTPDVHLLYRPGHYDIIYP